MPKKKDTKKESAKASKKTSFLRGGNLLVILLVGLLLFQYIQTHRVLGDFSLLRGHSSSLIDEIGQLKESQTQIGSDLAEVRSFLRMSVGSYGFEEKDSQKEESPVSEELQLAFFRYIDALSSTISSQKNLNFYTNLLEKLASSEKIISFLESEDLRFSNLSEDDVSIHLSLQDESGLELAKYRYLKSQEKLFFEFFDFREEINAKDASSLEDRLKTFINTEKTEMLKILKALQKQQAEVKELLDSKAVLQLKEDKNINVDENFLIRNSTGDIIGEIIFDPVGNLIYLEDASDNDFSLKVSDINKSLVPFLEKLDTRTLIEKRVDEAKEEIEETIQDDGFQLLLSQSGLAVSASPREDNLRYYYDIIDTSGNLVSSVVVEKSTGVVNITNPNGTDAQNIFFFEPESKKKTMNIPDNIPDYSSILADDKGDETLNVLVAGFAGALVDSMIFVHINHTRGDIRMISIPRDLFYQGRKINAFANFYGMDELKRVIGDITGYKPDKYVSIDMMAFIDVIDIIGGVEITLKNALIDPTYKVRDNGRISTLHYEPGTYHLGGIEALRLARSRYTTSDFARAERQQMILEAIQVRAKSFGIGDADTIYQIIRSVLRKTNTDISLDEAIVWFFRYQNYDVKAGNVMSSGNVLYVPPYITSANCRKMIEEAEVAGEEIPDCESQNQAYTLLPRDDNWNVIKWYFREIFEK